MQKTKFQVYVPSNEWAVHEVEAISRTAAIDDVMEHQHGKHDPAKVIQLDTGETTFAERKEG